jgi:predicted GNAT family acetyltransferase
MSTEFSVTREGDTTGAFVLRDGTHRAGRLDYRVEGNRLAIDYVVVVPRLRGRHLGVRLIDAAVAWARETGLTVRPYCGYAASVLRGSAIYEDVLERGPA